MLRRQWWTTCLKIEKGEQTVKTWEKYTHVFSKDPIREKVITTFFSNIGLLLETQAYSFHKFRSFPTLLISYCQMKQNIRGHGRLLNFVYDSVVLREDDINIWFSPSQLNNPTIHSEIQLIRLLALQHICLLCQYIFS